LDLAVEEEGERRIGVRDEENEVEEWRMRIVSGRECDGFKRDLAREGLLEPGEGRIRTVDAAVEHEASGRINGRLEPRILRTHADPVLPSLIGKAYVCCRITNPFYIY
jgi:hypothetical protein